MKKGGRGDHQNARDDLIEKATGQNRLLRRGGIRRVGAVDGFKESGRERGASVKE